MKRLKIPRKLRRLVAERAGFRCEYCRMEESDFYDPFQIDHIRSLRHEGKTELDNLAFSCPDCNRFKGSDVGSYLGEPPVFIPFFHPRHDDWLAHFDVADGLLLPQTAAAEVTIKMLRLNDPERVILRQELIKSGRFF